MKFAHLLGFGVTVALISCGPQRQPQQSTNKNSPAASSAAVSHMSNQVVAPQPAPTAALDPKSTEAALEMAQQFAKLLDQRKFEEAYMLLGPNSGFSSAADFGNHFSRYSGLTVTVVGSPPPMPQGAAGSIYLSVPARVSGTLDGKKIDHAATITMRRVNDVPGSTEAQRRWHIESFHDTAA